MSAISKKQIFLKIEHIRANPLDTGLALRKLRLSKDFSQLHVANCLDISRLAYRSWENNKVNLTLQNLSRLCQLYDIKLSYFVKEYLEE